MPRICVVGAGRWGRNHVRTLDELDCLGGLVDVAAETLQQFEQDYPHARGFASLDDALEAGFDGFTVATPAETHFDVASRIISAGIPVLVEKPLCLSSKEAELLANQAEECGVNLMVGHLMLFHPAILKIKSLIDSGDLGRVQYIYSNRINLGTVRKEENILWSFAPHDISIFQYLLDADPLEVHSQGAAFLQNGVQDTTMTTFKYPGNVMCHNYVSWLHPFKEHRIVVIGSKGMLSYEDSADRKMLFYKKGIDWIDDEPIKRDQGYDEVSFGAEMPLTEELRYFTEHLHQPIERASGRSAVQVLEVLERASASLSGEATPGTSGDVSGTATLAEGAFVHPSSYVDDGAVVGAGTKVWHYSHVQSGAVLGEKCTLGQNVNVGNNVVIGNGVKIQNNVSVFEGVELEDYVFCGPSMTFTNVIAPRSKYPQPGASAYARTRVCEGASIGANATIVCGSTVGRHAFIAAGAVVVSDVPDYAFMVGVPARQIGWVTEGGDRVGLDEEGVVVCSRSGIRYQCGAGSFEPMTDA